MKSYFTFDHAYRDTLQELQENGADVGAVADPTSVGSRFGQVARSTRELLTFGFRLTNPRARLLNSECRRFDLVFAVAQLVWILSGSDEVAPIAFYNPRGRDFSDDGQTMRGAYGRRLFNLNGLNQIEEVIHRLRCDPHSRRAAPMIYLPEDNATESRDIPCTLGYQFACRGGTLDMITYMRSQSAAFVMPYDVFSFTCLQEIIACELGLRLGTYHHICGSFHYYTDEMEMVTRLVDERLAPALPMPPMPGNTCLADLRRVVDYEEFVRHEALSRTLKPASLVKAASQLGPFWDQFGLILLTRAVYDEPAFMTILEELRPEYYRLIRQRAAAPART